MNNERKIGYHEALALLTIMMAGKVFLSFPRHLALLGQAAGWLIVLFSGLLSIGAFYFLYTLTQRFPSKTIIEIFHQVAGKILGPIFSMAIFVFFLLSASLTLRQFAESFIVAILPRTPISIIITLFLILVIYANIAGIETITRVAWFFGPYLFLALGVIICFSLPQASLANLSPFLGPGPLELLKNSVVHTGLYAEIILFLLIAPLIRKSKKLFKVGFSSLGLAVITNTAITVTVIAVFNFVGSNKLVFPILQLSRLISFSEFLQRFESVFVFLWFFTAAIEISGLFYGALLSFGQTFKIKNRLPLIFPLSILIFTLSLIPDSMTAAINLDDFIIGNYYPIVAFGVPFLFWLITTIFKKRFKTSNV